jgi:hypothetical protein
MVIVPGCADHSSPSAPVHTPEENDSVAGDDVSNWASVPALRSDTDSNNVTEPRGYAFNRSPGPSHSIVDLIKAGKRKFSDGDPNQSPRTVRMSFSSAYKLIHQIHEEAVGNAHEVDVGDTLEDDVGNSLDDDVGNTVEDDVGIALEDDVVDSLEGDAEESSEHLGTYIAYVVKNPREKRFENGIKAEMEGLLSRDVFELVSENSVPVGSNIMGFKFHLVVNNSEPTQPVCKARLVIFGQWTPRRDGYCQKHPQSVR